MVLNNPITRGKMPPDVQVEDRKLGDEALCSHSNNQDHEGRQAHRPELQHSQQLTPQPCRVRRQFRHKEFPYLHCKLPARSSVPAGCVSRKFTGLRPHWLSLGRLRAAPPRKIPPTHAGYDPRFFMGKGAILYRPCKHFPPKQLYTCEAQCLWYRVCQGICRMTVSCGANS